MDYVVEVYDTLGLRVARYDDVPALEAVCRRPDEADTVRGLLPPSVPGVGPGCEVRVLVDGREFCRCEVTRVAPEWSDLRKLAVDRYVYVHELVPFEAVRPARVGNTEVSPVYVNRDVAAMVRDVINRAPGPVHYTVAHEAWPDGAEREFAKFAARMRPDNELETGGIGAGQWIGADRIDATNAWAKDGDTIAGLVVDGEAWPDLRLMMIDCEETSLNPHAMKRHPETAGWTAARYAASGYKLKADAAQAALQAFMDECGVDYIELNPHTDASGAYDDRVDAYGRYIGLVYGGGRCFNAALVELDLADVYLYSQGRYHVPEMALKDFFSYRGPHGDSVEPCETVLESFDVTGGVYEALTALAYAGGCAWSADTDLAVRFRGVDRADRVVFRDPVRTSVELGATSRELANILYFAGNPFPAAFTKTFLRGSSLDAYGAAARRLEYFALSREPDADKLAAGLLADIAYPEPQGRVTFHWGESGPRVGDVVEVRGERLRRVDAELEDEWDGRFAGRLVAGVRSVTHRFHGRRAVTELGLGSPLRSVGNPLGFLVRSQPGAHRVYEFRLDDETVGLDMGYHLG